jgi:integrase/recombinase XerC
MASLPQLPFKGASFFRRGPSFKVTFYDRHTRRTKQITLASHDPGIAYREAYDLAQRWQTGLFDPWQDRARLTTLEQAVTRFLAHGSAWSRYTLNQRSYVLRLFERSLPPGLTVDAVTAEQCRRFIMAPRLKDASKRSYYNVLSTFFNWCVRERYLRTAPTARVAKPKATRTLPPYFTRQQFARLLRVMEADLLLRQNKLAGGLSYMPDLCRLSVATGLRRGELVHLRWRDVDLKERLLFVRRYKDTRRGYEFVPKWKIERSVPLFPIALEVLSRLNEARTNDDDTETVFTSPRPLELPTGDVISRPLSRRRITRNFNTYRKLAKLPEELHLHSLRHTFASWLVSDGERLERIQRWMGHKNLSQTQVYAHLSPEALKGRDVRTFDRLENAQYEGERAVLPVEGVH